MKQFILSGSGSFSVSKRRFLQFSIPIPIAIPTTTAWTKLELLGFKTSRKSMVKMMLHENDFITVSRELESKVRLLAKNFPPLGGGG